MKKKKNMAKKKRLKGKERRWRHMRSANKKRIFRDVNMRRASRKKKKVNELEHDLLQRLKLILEKLTISSFKN